MFYISCLNIHSWCTSRFHGLHVLFIVCRSCYMMYRSYLALRHFLRFMFVQMQCYMVYMFCYMAYKYLDMFPVSCYLIFWTSYMIHMSCFLSYLLKNRSLKMIVMSFYMVYRLLQVLLRCLKEI